MSIKFDNNYIQLPKSKWMCLVVCNDSMITSILLSCKDLLDDLSKDCMTTLTFMDVMMSSEIPTIISLSFYDIKYYMMKKGSKVAVKRCRLQPNFQWISFQGIYYLLNCTCLYLFIELNSSDDNTFESYERKYVWLWHERGTFWIILLI